MIRPKKILYIFLLFGVLSCSNSEDTQFTSLFCRSTNDCTDHKADIKFTVNVEKNLVLARFHNQGKLVSTEFLKDCQILDKQNWECTMVVNEKTGFMYKVKRMGEKIETSDPNVKFVKVTSF